MATTAMASGVEGATFFAPIFMLGLGLPPEVAIGTGLITEVFGFASGLSAYFRRRLIDFRLGLALIVVTLPMAPLGSWLANLIEAEILKTILGMGLFGVALSFLRSPQQEDVGRMDRDIDAEYGGELAETWTSIVRSMLSSSPRSGSWRPDSRAERKRRPCCPRSSP